MNVYEASWNWGQLGIAFAVGLAVGVLVVYLLMCRSARVAKLRAELERAKAEHEDYRRQVHDHFGKTSVLFHHMTSSYRAVYEHLAEGCESLCADATMPGQLELPDTQLIGEHGAGPGTKTAARKRRGTRAQEKDRPATVAPRPSGVNLPFSPLNSG